MFQLSSLRIWILKLKCSPQTQTIWIKLASLLSQVKESSLTPEEAAVELGKQCTCNVFNTERAVTIIREYSHHPIE